MIDPNPNLSIIILSVNGLNTLIKTQRLSDWLKEKKGHAAYKRYT